MKSRHILIAALSVLTLTACGPKKTIIKLQPGERVWAGKVAQGIDLPAEGDLTVDMHNNFARRMPVLEEQISELKRSLDK